MIETACRSPQSPLLQQSLVGRRGTGDSGGLAVSDELVGLAIAVVVDPVADFVLAGGGVDVRVVAVVREGSLWVAGRPSIAV